METKRNNIRLGIVVLIGVLILGVGVYAAMSGGEGEPIDQREQGRDTTEPSNGESQTPQTDTSEFTGTIIEFTDSGFTEQRYTVRAGEEVTVRNSSSTNLEFSSDDHPTHREQPSMNTSVIGPGQTTVFTAPATPGAYGFHDHINARHTGVLEVIE